MAYTNKSYFLLKIDEQELNKLTAGSDEVLDSAIQSADSLIDSYLKNVLIAGPSGAIGLDDYPPVIKQCSYDIAVFYLHDRIQYSETPKWVQDKYTSAIDLLTKLSKGEIFLNESYISEEDNIKHFGNNTVMDRGSF